jgi:DNA-directed RNA polymerase specialized sigma subunit
MFYFERRSLPEIAAAMGISPARTSALHAQALLDFREGMQHLWRS